MSNQDIGPHITNYRNVFIYLLIGTALTVCDASTQYESAAKTLTSDRVCENLEVNVVSISIGKGCRRTGWNLHKQNIKEIDINHNQPISLRHHCKGHY